IDWTCYVSDQFVEKRNLMLATGDLPDVILNAEMSQLDLLKYAGQGVIVPVEELIDQHMPNLKKILDENPNYRKLITAPDGHIYSFPWIEQLGTGKEAIQAIGGMPFINKAWLDQLGLPMPTTTQELEDTLIAFKENIPNAIPMSFIINGGNEDLGFILGAFGYGDNPDHIMVDENNKVIYTTTQEGYKEGIKWLNSLNEKGLIDPEAFTQDWGTLTSKGKNDVFGLYFGWDNYGVPGTSSAYVPLPALKGPSGLANAPRQSGTQEGGFTVGKAVITSDCADSALAASWIDLMYDPIQSVQNNWGTYGEEGANNIFELTSEGTLKHVPLDSLTVSPWDARCAQMVEGPLAVLDSYYDVYTTCPPDALERMDYVKSYVPDMRYEMVYPQVFMTQEDVESMVRLQTQINEYAQQMKATWILSGGIDKDWDDYLKKLDELGLQEYLGIRQKYLDAYLAE
ncbi:MAG: extracellular solute-binding protein, partial [Vallitaleaceae bacterium]|nr:extracellular solute-binding protein [Vallitaleaceae bacterium]